ncbi:SIR2 family protein [Pseudoalteromonas sp. PAB 2.2]|uniref:SIR2 family protein n=1 Tax=Pseudoalteromonas sp. PAB 2.2 TaxID=1841508 RepID=UPI00094FA2BB|nr:SIR2 family protein [Pseudoalteromonas sp. PAB 2.2]
MDLYDSHLKHIIKANDENRLAIFIGSGISKSSDTSSFEMPLWEDLISSMKSDLQSCNETDYLKIAQLYFLEFEETNYFNKIKSFFPDNIPPSELHKTIFELNPNCVITTNWDCLLESAIETTGALYSVVCSDKDLVKSTMNKKLIKMHGDFKNHNIVFKEDDYLSYSHNFPLIENYIKSILSTHTVLFLGYGYNDINLKQIMKWIQNNSKYSPSKYLVVSKENRSQSNYLKNHGIKTLVLPSLEVSSSEINRYSILPERSRKVAYFLDDIKNSKFKQEKDLSDIEVIELVSQKVNHLQNLNFVLIDQIRGSLSNSGYEYDFNANAILELFSENGVLTKDYNKSTRLIHTKFVDILEKLDKGEISLDSNKELDNFMEILAKARVSGVILNSQDLSNKCYYVNPKKLNNEEIYDALNFKLDRIDDNSSTDLKNSFKTADLHYKTYNFKQAYLKTSEIITICKSQKNYGLLLIALFNINNIINKLKYSLNSLENDWEKGLETFDLQEQFLQFPKSEIKKQQVLYDFVSLKSIYIQSFKNINYLLGVANAVESTKNGGLNFNAQAEKPAVEHANIVLFSVMNNILINENVFFEMMENFVEISIVRQSLNEEVNLNIYELFTCIKYFKGKKLKILLEKYFYSKEERKKINVKDTDLSWLIDQAFKNIMENHLSANSIFECREDELTNIIYLLSFLNINEPQTELVVTNFKRLISSDNNTMGTYESINFFLALQYNLFKNKINNNLLIELIESIITKIVYRNASGFDIFAFTGNSISNLYSYIKINDGIFTNAKLVEKLISEISDLDLRERIKYSRSLIHPVFNIGNDEIKIIIKNFINDVISESSKNEISKNVNFELNLWFIAAGYLDEPTEELLTDFHNYLVSYLKGSSFSSEFYSLRGIIKYLIEEKNHVNLEECKELVDQIINKYESRAKISTI